METDLVFWYLAILYQINLLLFLRYKYENYITIPRLTTGFAE